MAGPFASSESVLLWCRLRPHLVIHFFECGRPGLGASKTKNYKAKTGARDPVTQGLGCEFKCLTSWVCIPALTLLGYYVKSGFIYYYFKLLFVYLFLAMPGSLWHLSSLTRD